MWGNAGTDMDESGGFMSETNDNTSDADDKVKRSQNIVPLMIGHILNSGEQLEIWGLPIRVVCVVGVALEVEELTTKTVYRIEDDTGEIKVFYWVEGSKAVTVPTIAINTYVRVTGLVRHDENGTHIFALQVVPLKSINELTYHMFDVTHTMLKAEKLASEINVPNMDETNKQASNTNYRGLTSDQAVIFKLIQEENETECGIEKDVLLSRIPEYLLPKAEDIISFLTSEGHAYTTRTENHFKTT